MKKYRLIDKDVFEVLEINGKEVGVANRTQPLRRQIEALHILAKHNK